MIATVKLSCSCGLTLVPRLISELPSGAFCLTKYTELSQIVLPVLANFIFTATDWLTAAWIESGSSAQDAALIKSGTLSGKTSTLVFRGLLGKI